MQKIMPKRIELYIHNNDHRQFERFLNEFIASEATADNPTTVEHIPDIYGPFTYEPGGSEFAVVRYSPDSDEHHIELAKINFSQYNDVLVVFFESPSTEIMWEDIEDVVRKIINKAEELQFEIYKIIPENLKQSAQSKPWEMLKENDKRHSELLKLWWEGDTNSEIAMKIGGIVSKTVTNVISRLRVRYGESIVPRNSERRKPK